MRHSSLLVPTIEKLLKKAGVKLNKIDCFCISAGPGSFTGLRIGVTTIKGLGFALNTPIVAVPTLDVIACNVKNFKGIVCPVLDARKNKVYACFYKSDGKNMKRISKYLLISAEELMKKSGQYDNVVFLGDALHLIGKPENKKINWHPRADIAAKLGMEYFKNNKLTSAEDLEPMYLYSRECDIKGV